MKQRNFAAAAAAALFLASASLASATSLNARSESAQSTSVASLLSWYSVNGVVWGQRDLANYILQFQYTTSAVSMNPYGFQVDPSLEAAASLATGGYNLFTTSSIATANAVVNTGVDNSGYSLGGFEILNINSPGSLLAEWNPVPDIRVWTSGVAAVDDYSRNFTPGSLLGGGLEDFQFTPPDMILAGAYHAPAPVLSSTQLSAAGVTPENFSGVPAVTTATVLSSSTAPSGSAPAPVTVVQTVSSVAEQVQTTTVNNGVVTLAGSPRTLTAQTVGGGVPPAASLTPEPSSMALFAVAAFGAAALRRRRRQ